MRRIRVRPGTWRDSQKALNSRKANKAIRLMVAANVSVCFDFESRSLMGVGDGKAINRSPRPVKAIFIKTRLSASTLTSDSHVETDEKLEQSAGTRALDEDLFPFSPRISRGVRVIGVITASLGTCVVRRAEIAECEEGRGARRRRKLTHVRGPRRPTKLPERSFFHYD